MASLLEELSMNDRITISISYNIKGFTGDESHKNESGYIVACDKISFRELVKALKDEFIYQSCDDITDKTIKSVWFTSKEFPVGYYNNAVQVEHLHISDDDVSQRALRRALKMLRKV